MPDLLYKLPMPTIWAGVSFIIGVGLTGTAYHLVLKRYGPLQTRVLKDLSNANDKLVELQTKQLDTMERTLQMQKNHYEEEIKELRARNVIEVEDAKREWQECRTLLHTKREEWNDESLKMQLTIKEFESRPDMRSLNVVLTEVVELLKTVVTDIKVVGETLVKHDENIDKQMQQFAKVIKGGRK